MHKQLIDLLEYRSLLSGGTVTIEADKPEAWLSDRSWSDLLITSQLPAFEGLYKSFSNPEDIAIWKAYFDDLKPHTAALPEFWDTKLDSFQKLIILKCMRPDKLTNGMQNYIAEKMGNRFIEPQSVELDAVYADSTPNMPLVFVLSQGTDPAQNLQVFAEKMKMDKKLSVISLGQGQGPKAEAAFMAAIERGRWVFFQNCHLAPSWMPRLEFLIESIDADTAHRDFRMWLTSMPTPKFPVSILQNSSKMTVEPPKGIKANLMKAYGRLDQEFLMSCSKTFAFKNLMFSLCLFHGVSLERRKYGALGFNIPYEFTDGDLGISMDQLKMFLDEYEEIPFKVLTYTTGHINYGGRVTDDWDRRCMMSILADFYRPEVLAEDYSFDPSKIYHVLPESNSAAHEFVEYIKTLPINDTPEIFGLHDNANITFAQTESYNVLNDLVTLQSGGGGSGGANKEELVGEMATELAQKIPAAWNLEEIQKTYPVVYEESMNTVLQQEVVRYNGLLDKISNTLVSLKKAIKGLVVMDDNLEKMFNSIFDNKVPNNWAGKAYPSLKPLSAWVIDLLERVEFIQDWIDNGVPAMFWISGFFFPQAFLTGSLQNFARKYTISIDTISFDFEVSTLLWEDIKDRPEDGCFIRGLFVEAAIWDREKMQLAESRPKELYTDMAPIWLKPSVNRVKPGDGIYICPIYKTLQRAGTLSTTGHSTNFVIAVEVPTDKEEEHWIKRGVALFCALNY